MASPPFNAGKAPSIIQGANGIRTDLALVRYWRAFFILFDGGFFVCPERVSCFLGNEWVRKPGSEGADYFLMEPAAEYLLGFRCDASFSVRTG